MKYLLLIFSFSFLFFSCKKTAQSLVDASIEAHGGKKYDTMEASFEFRDKLYTIKNNNGEFEYTRTEKDSSNNLVEYVVSNDIFKRLINGKEVATADSMIVKYKSSVNSVAYFFLLPKPLNDAAVNKELIGEININGQEYDKIRVKFNEEGGGNDHQDVFVYWINKKSKIIDFLAYSYETDGGGVRFREAFNSQVQNGIRYQDYRNYGYEDLKIAVEDLDKKFIDKTMPLKSEIVNLNVIIK